jgi:hypothetical protein
VREESPVLPRKKSLGSTERMVNQSELGEAGTGKKQTAVTMEESANLADLIQDLPDIPKDGEIRNQEMEAGATEQHMHTAEFNKSRDSQMFLNAHVKYLNQTNAHQTNQTSLEPPLWGLGGAPSPSAKQRNAQTPLSIQNLCLASYAKNRGRSKIQLDKKPLTAGSRKTRKVPKQFQTSKTRQIKTKIDYQEIERNQGKIKKIETPTDDFGDSQHLRFYSSTYVHLKEQELYNIDKLKHRLQIPRIDHSFSLKDPESRDRTSETAMADG